MIKANELRVGSLVNYLPIEPEDQLCKIDWNDIRWLSENPDSFNINHKPIPITEEWLVKLGFEKDNDDFILETNSFLLVSHNDDELVHLKSNLIEIISSVKYIHQLQNLYFALTNEELTIKQTQ